MEKRKYQHCRNEECGRIVPDGMEYCNQPCRRQQQERERLRTRAVRNDEKPKRGPFIL